MRFLFLILFLLLIGCGKQPAKIPTGPHSLNADELRLCLEYTNGLSTLDCSRISDKEYVFPTREWIKGEFTKSLQDYFYTIGKSKYIPSVFDCENHTQISVGWANILHANSSNRPKEAGLAVAEYEYITRDNGGHSLILFIVFENNKFTPVFYESQNFQIVELTKEEKYNTLFFKF